VTDVDTAKVDELMVAALHLGGMDFHGYTARDVGASRYASAAEGLWRAFPTQTLPRLIRHVGDVAADGSDAREFTLEDALPSGRQRIVDTVFSELTGRFREQYSRLYHDHRRILEMLVDAGYELPKDLRAAAELTLDAELDSRLRAAVLALDDVADTTAFTGVLATVRLAREQGYALDLSAVEEALSANIATAAQVAARTLGEADADRVEAWLDLAESLAVTVDLSRPQELIWDAATRARAGRLSEKEEAVTARLGTRLGLSPVAWSRPT
jgi:hypothetical protein